SPRFSISPTLWRYSKRSPASYSRLAAAAVSLTGAGAKGGTRCCIWKTTSGWYSEVGEPVGTSGTGGAGRSMTRPLGSSHAGPGSGVLGTAGDMEVGRSMEARTTGAAGTGGGGGGGAGRTAGTSDMRCSGVTHPAGVAGAAGFGAGGAGGGAAAAALETSPWYLAGTLPAATAAVSDIFATVLDDSSPETRICCITS